MIDGQKDALQSVKRHRELSQGRYFAYNGTRKRVIGKKAEADRSILSIQVEDVNGCEREVRFHATKGRRIVRP